MPAAAIVLLFLALKVPALHLLPGDEGIYFYMASRVSEGALPYRDFFFSHPPLHLAPAVLLFHIAGFSMWTARLLPIGFAVLTLVCLGWTARRFGTWAPLGAMIAFAFSHDVLRASSHFTGANLAALLTAVGLACLGGRRERWAGVAFAAAGATAVYALPTGLAAVLGLLLYDRRRGMRLGLALVVGLVLFNLVGVLAGGSDYLSQVYLYHLHKPPRTGSSGPRVLLGMLAAQPVLVLGGLVGGWLALRHLPGLLRRRAADGKGSVPATCAALAVPAQVAMLLLQARIYPYYLLVPYVSLALLAGLATSTAIRRLLSCQGRKRLAIGAFGVLAIAAGLAPGISAYPRHEGHRWESEATINLISELAGADETLFGSSAIAPLCALLSDRRLALDEADTNALRFASGTTAMASLLARLDQAPPEVLVLYIQTGIMTHEAFAGWAKRHYLPAATFVDHRQQRYLVWRRLHQSQDAAP